MKFSAIIPASALVATTVAAPTSTAPTPVATTCTVTAFADVPSATASCANIELQNLNIPTNSTLDLSKLKTGTSVVFSGKTTVAYTNWTSDIMKIGGTNIHISGKLGHTIDGNGQAWWDGQGSNGGLPKPDHFITVSKALGNSVIENLYIQNYPTHCFSISGAVGLLMQNIILNNAAGNAPNARSNGLPAAHNSDGFDISTSQNMTLRNSVVTNQDDCVAITSGNNITSSNISCTGSHGLSIGSVGGKSNNNVTNIFFKDSMCTNCQNGARIKSNSGTTGYIENIVYENIALYNISTYGIDVQQDYLNGGPTGIPTNGVIIKDIVFKNIVGTAQKSAKDYYVLCGTGSCSNITFTGVSVVGGSNDTCNYGNCPITH